MLFSFPDIDPIAFSVGPFKVYWYGLAYVFGILFAWYYAVRISKSFGLKITPQHLEDFVTWAIIGIVVGARLGYVLFYDVQRYISKPIDILKTYEGGMSFHGGLLGLVVSSYLFCKLKKISFIALTDILTLVAPVGLFLGRIANFINGEIYGRITDVPWAIIFPNSDGMPRHPSQLYQAFSEGVVIFVVLNYINKRLKVILEPGILSGLFLILYSLFRCFTEIFKEPDIQIAFIFDKLAMGQILSIPMFLFGIYLIMYCKFLKNCK